MSIGSMLCFATFLSQIEKAYHHILPPTDGWLNMVKDLVLPNESDKLQLDKLKHDKLFDDKLQHDKLFALTWP